jgi:FtsP/CotA-like multicopper oxidase with cupredoxin domain
MVRQVSLVTVLAGWGWVEPAPAQTLSTPAVLANLSSAPGTVEVTITAAPARLSLVPDALSSEAYAYNGRVPGPTLEVREGDSVIVHFRNDLPLRTPPRRNRGRRDHVHDARRG